MKFDLDEFRNRAFAVFCNTGSKARKFVDYLCEQGFKWRDGECLNQNSIWWFTAEDNNIIGYEDEGIYIGNYYNTGKPVYKYEDLEFEKEIKEMNNLGKAIMEYFGLELGDIFRFHGIKNGTNFKFLTDKEGNTVLFGLLKGGWRTCFDIDLGLLLKISKKDIEVVKRNTYFFKQKNKSSKIRKK